MSEELLNSIVERIIRSACPDKVILFGSRARGEAKLDSDFDFLVIKECTEARHLRDAPLYRALYGVGARIDVVVYTPAEAKEWQEVPKAFITTVLREGKVLYERQG